MNPKDSGFERVCEVGVCECVLCMGVSISLCESACVCDVWGMRTRSRLSVEMTQIDRERESASVSARER